MRMRLATFDVYPKTLSEFRQRTLTGAAVSIACTLLIAVLTVIEVADYLQVRQDDHLFVDTSRGQQLRINLNVTFPALPCSVLSLDTLDVSGNHAANINVEGPQSTTSSAMSSVGMIHRFTEGHTSDTAGMND